MLSRVAETFYWMSIYIERAENYARFMDVNFNLSLDMPPEDAEQWEPLVVITGDKKLYESSFKEIKKSTVIYFLGFDPHNPNSIYSSIIKSRENARAIRSEITREVWEQVNALYYFVQKGLQNKLWKKRDPRDFFMEVKKHCQLLYGIFDASISRTEGWHFGKIGQLIERCDKTSRVLDVKYHILLPATDAVGSSLDLIHWSSMLKSTSAYDMYRKKNGKLVPLSISEFLILDKDFPRSMLNCLASAELSLCAVSGTKNGQINKAERQLGMLKSQLIYADINDIFRFGLHEYLDDFQKKLNEVSNTICEHFFRRT